MIIGVQDYAFLPDINGVRSTTSDWEAFFRDTVQTKHVKVLVDTQAVREEILETAAQLPHDSTGRVWVVFVGHGASVNGEPVLLGVDTQQTIKSIASRGITQTELLAAVTRESNSVILVADACFSGRAPSGEALVPNTQAVIPVKMSAPSKSVILTAAAGDEVAGPTPDGQRPAFSYLLLGAMRGWARGQDDTVTASEAVSFVAREMRKVHGRVQTPQFYGEPQTALVSGVREAAPSLDAPIVATRATVSDRSEAKTTAESTTDVSDGINLSASPKWNPYWFTSGAGIGVELKREAFTPVISARGGVHLGSAESWRTRLGAELTYVRGGNSNYDQVLDDIATVEQTLGPLGRPTEGQHTERILAAVTAGAAVDVGLVLSAELLGGLNAAPFGRCDRWDLSDPSNAQSDLVCAHTGDAPVGAVVGGRLGAQLGWAELGVNFHIDLGAEEEAFLGMVLSFNMNP
ncbi:MAG: caspase family protein [bacterium]